MDLVSLAVGLIVGVAAGGFAIFGLDRLRKPKMASGTIRAQKMSDLKPTTIGKSVEETEMEKARKNLKTFLLEKELLAGALTRVYEAESEGKITKEEREHIANKYREQLKVVDGKLGDIELLIEVGELENLRTELVGLFERKIGQIESRLDEARVKLDHIRGVKLPPEEPAVAKIEQKKVEKRKAKAPESEADEKVKALRNEVLEALARLEQMDIEG